MSDELHKAEDRGLWDAVRVAEELSVSVRTVRRLQHRGKLRAVNVGAGGQRRWRFDPNAVRAFARGEAADEQPLITRRDRSRRLSSVPAYF